MNNAKPIYQSVTFWWNVAWALLALADILMSAQLIPPAVLPYVMAAVTFGNVLIRRFVTSAPATTTAGQAAQVREQQQLSMPLDPAAMAYLVGLIEEAARTRQDGPGATEAAPRDTFPADAGTGREYAQ